jgi:hypothetical protein
MPFLSLLAPAVLIAQALNPFVSISYPAPNTVITGRNVTVQLSVSPGFRIVDYHLHPEATLNQGHYHLWLDAQALNPSSAIMVTTPTYTFQNVKPGNHTLTVELVTNNHTSLIPRVTNSVSFRTAIATDTFIPLSRFTFQITIFALLLILSALYFSNLHINNLHSVSKSKKSKPKSKSK